MKALSIKQPYAELIVSGRKTIELRTWSTSFRGEFLIHASASPDKAAMQQFGYQNLPTGCIIGKATLREVKKYTSNEEFRKDQDKHLASQVCGNYGFLLEEAARLPEIQCKGNLGFWEFDVDNKVQNKEGIAF